MPLACGYITKWSYGDSNFGPLACHADSVRRPGSAGVGRGASGLQKQSENVAGSRGKPEYGGSRRWLPCGRLSLTATPRRSPSTLGREYDRQRHEHKRQSYQHVRGEDYSLSQPVG